MTLAISFQKNALQNQCLGQAAEIQPIEHQQVQSSEQQQVAKNNGLTPRKKLQWGLSAQLYGSPIGLLIHEISHLVATRALFVDSNPFIGFKMLDKHMVCFTNVGGPLNIPRGSWGSRDFRIGLIFAAGPLADLCSIVFASLISLKMKRSRPWLSSVLAVHSLFTAISSFHYSMIREPWTDYYKMEKELGVSQGATQTMAGICLIVNSLLVLHVTGIADSFKNPVTRLTKRIENITHSITDRIKHSFRNLIF